MDYRDFAWLVAGLLLSYQKQRHYLSPVTTGGPRQEGRLYYDHLFAIISNGGFSKSAVSTLVEHVDRVLSWGLSIFSEDQIPEALRDIFLTSVRYARRAPLGPSRKKHR